MKFGRYFLFLIMLIAFLGIQTHAQLQVPSASPLAIVAQSVGFATVTVGYNRLTLMNHTMFGHRLVIIFNTEKYGGRAPIAQPYLRFRKRYA